MKYKQGDYITTTNHTFQRVLAALEQAAGPIYAVGELPKSPKKIIWMTESELDGMNMSKQEPNFEGFEQLKAGDILKMGERNMWSKVLARIGEVVLLSNVNSEEAHSDLLKLNELVQEITGGDGPLDLDTETRQHIAGHRSITKMHQEATEWFSVKQLALMNWTVVTE